MINHRFVVNNKTSIFVLNDKFLAQQRLSYLILIEHVLCVSSSYELL